jgi:hypothetical protein
LVPPPAVRVDEKPLHIATGAVTVIVGDGLTTTDTDPVFLQVLPSVTVIEYVVVVVIVGAVGLTVCEAALPALLQL